MSNLDMLKFIDEDGNYHVIDGTDFEAFDEAMLHEDWSLVFD